MLNRRSFLRAAPIAGVALTVPAVASAVAPEHPLVKAKRLAREISATLESIEPDDRPSCIMVFPDNSRGYRFGIVS